jgi:NADPH:quinone reductase-like Zn-dependent oxidoreductase
MDGETVLLSDDPMKAIVYERYGSADVLRLKDVDNPTVADDAVLVRVRASAVNAMDWHGMRGEPLIARLSEGLRRPKLGILGGDAAGIVDAVGKEVRDLHPGDEVFGVRTGAFAEYVSGRTFVPKPSNLTFEQAAAIPVAATTALQGLRDKGELQPGQRVLINGAGGGVGHFAVQIAKALGAAEVTGVTSTANVEMVGSIGADHVIDYEREDFTKARKRYDLILDIAGNRPMRAMRRALVPKGTFVFVGGPGGRWVSPADRALKAAVMSPFVSQRMLPFLAHISKEDLIVLKELAETGKLRPVIDRTYPLAATADALRYVETMHACGKVVITV